MEEYKFEEFDVLPKKGRAQLIKETGRLLNQNSGDWTYHCPDRTRNRHHIVKDFQNNGDDIEVEFICHTGSAYLGDRIGYEMETSPDGHDPEDKEEELLDAFEEIEDDFTKRAHYKKHLS